MTDAAIIIAKPRVTVDVLLKNIDRTTLYAPFLSKYVAVLDACSRDGADFYVAKDGGYRSFDEQTALFLKGRYTPSWDAAQKPPFGTPVTDARGGRSLHQYGIAADATRDADLTRAGLQPDWNDASYEVLGKHAKALRLDAGWFWKKPDRPHVNLDIKSRGLDMPVLLAEYRRWSDKAYAMQRVKELLNAHGPW